MLQTGAPLPDVRADDDAGHSVALKDLAKKTVLVVYFYPRANTPGCTTETIQFGDLYNAFTKKKAIVVGVSRDSVQAQAKFKEKYDIPFPLLADIDSAICDAFGVIVEKNMYGKKSLGIQRSTFIVKDGVIAKVWPKVSVDGHAAEVLKSL